MAAFTTIATAAGLAISAGSTAASFAQAGKQRRLQREAESEANKFMAEARKKLDVNYMEALSVNMQPYEMAREAAVSAGAQQIEAARESERGVAATAGRLQMAQTEAQQQVRAAMGQELSALEMATAQEESRLRDIQTQLDLGEVQGAQQAAADAQEAAAQATAEGFQGLTSTVQQGLEMVPLYQQTRAGKAMAGVEANYNKIASEGLLDKKFMKDGKAIPFQQALDVVGKNKGFEDFAGIGSLTGEKFNERISSIGAKKIKGMSDYSIFGANITPRQNPLGYDEPKLIDPGTPIGSTNPDEGLPNPFDILYDPYQKNYRIKTKRRRK